MPLDDKRRREIRQLMFVAFHYLRLAAGAAGEKHSSVTFGSLTEEFPLTGDAVAELLRERTVISADLASAATRFASVDEVLERAGSGRSVYSECRKYFGVDSRLPEINLRDSPKWFHILLRDVISHAEPKIQTSHDTQHERRWRAREEFIAEVRLGWAYSRLHQTADELVGLLETRSIHCGRLNRLGLEAPEDPGS